VVVIEETDEPEYFDDKRIQISIFMSPTDVHANRVPFSGKLVYKKYHKGKYLVAWHPKSSTENERMTVVFEREQFSILVRQIAGAMARRIKNYLEEGQRVEQGQEMGFIKFGSRVDIFLPLDAVVKVQIGDKVKGNVDVLGVVMEGACPTYRCGTSIDVPHLISC
jgi:phosphatidylserine decarboxylase